MPITITNEINDPALKLGVVAVEGGEVRPSGSELKTAAEALATKYGAEGWELPDGKRKAVRDMLRAEGFSPTGRNRPAHELLLKDIKERGGFNHINNVVDVNNVISLEYLLPVSIFDLDKIGDTLIVRYGREGEEYVFNQSAQVLALKRLVVCCRGDGTPVGSPVKDSMETKVFPGASRFLGVMYIPAGYLSSYAEINATQRFADLLAAETEGVVKMSRLM